MSSRQMSLIGLADLPKLRAFAYSQHAKAKLWEHTIFRKQKISLHRLSRLVVSRLWYICRLWGPRSPLPKQLRNQIKPCHRLWYIISPCCLISSSSPLNSFCRRSSEQHTFVYFQNFGIVAWWYCAMDVEGSLGFLNSCGFSFRWVPFSAAPYQNSTYGQNFTSLPAYYHT